MYQKDVTVVSLMFLALYSGSLLSLTGISLPVIDYVTIYSFLYVCLQCLLKCGTLLIVRSAPFGRVWPRIRHVLGTWLSARVLSSFEMIFKTVYIDRERYGMDTGPLGVLCSFWHQDLGSGAFGSCRLYGRVCRDWAHSGASHGCLIGLGSREFREQVNPQPLCHVPQAVP